MSAVVLGPFHLCAPLGRGGMGEVWRATHPSERIEVAVKRLRAPTEEGRRRVRHEVRAVAALRHPGIVGIFDHGFTGEVGWIAMELAEGTLRDHPPRDAAEVREVVLRVLDALAHAHARDVVHRDIKPSNLLWFGGAVKLADFGIARTGPGGGDDASGTPRYMAPEQLRGDVASQGPWTDLFALGSVVWEWLEGEPPPRDGPVVPARHPSWGDWFQRMLAPTPEARPRSAAEAAWLVPRQIAGPAGPTPVAPTRLEWTRTLTALVEAGESPLGESGQRVEVPLPADWRPPHEAPSVRHLHAAGLGLFGIRPVPLVGREAQQDDLWSALREARNGPVVRVLAGPAGVGKSRLAEWLVRRASECGQAVAVARHSPGGGVEDGIGPMLQSLTGVHRAPPERWRDLWVRWLYHRGARAGLVDALEALVRPRGEGRAFSSAEQRQDAVLELLAAAGVAVLHVDDAQWGGDAVGVVRRAMARGLPLLAVLTVRDDLDGSALEGIERGPPVWLGLGPLPAGRWRELVGGMLGIDSPLAASIAERTGGNPLFAVHLIGDWVARGLLVPGERGFVLAEGAAVALPRDLAAVWRARIEAVVGDETGRRGLAVAACLGIDVDGREWELACAGLGLAAPVEVRERMLARNLARGTDRTWSFAHGMIREAALVDRSDVPALHRACAEALGTLHGRGQAARRARHLARGGALEDALDPYLQAARTANASTDHGSALALIAERDLALDQLGVGPGHPWRAESDLVRVSVRRNTGDLDGALRLAAEIAERGDSDDPRWRPLMADALVLQSMIVHFRGDYTGALGLQDRAEALGCGDQGVHSFRAASLIALFRWDEAARECERGLADPRCPFNKRGELLRMRGQVEWRRNRLAESVPWLERALDAASSSGDRTVEMFTLTELGAVRHLEGKYDEARRWYGEAVEAIGGPDATDALVPRTNLATVIALAGDEATAWGQVQPLLERAEALGWRETRAFLQVIAWATCPDPDEQDARFGPMRAEVDDIGLRDPDFVILAGRVLDRRRTAGDADGAGMVEAFLAAQRRALAADHAG